MVIVETTDDVKLFKKSYKKQDSIVIPILSDVNKHPVENNLSLIYIQMMDGNEFIIPYNHSETIIGHNINLFSDTTKYTHDKKLLGQLYAVGKVIDVNLLHYMKTNQPYDFEQHLTNAHHHCYRLHYDKQNINDVVPLVKHAEYFKPI